MMCLFSAPQGDSIMPAQFVLLVSVSQSALIALFVCTEPGTQPSDLIERKRSHYNYSCSDAHGEIMPFLHLNTFVVDRNMFVHA